MQSNQVTRSILRFENGQSRPAEDSLAVEEPLEIRLGFGPLRARKRRTVALTMRTPGNDRELAAGFLFTEGVIQDPADLLEIALPEEDEADGRQNLVRVELRPEVEVDLGRLQRHFYTTSSCGVCGKTSLDALETASGISPLPVEFTVAASVLTGLPDSLRAAQEVFGRTGGLHGCAFFSPAGELLCTREDVGRHNALDKLIGAELLAETPVTEPRILLLSGRASFELLQKSVMAGVPLVAAVGAPSSLAVEVADRFGITLAGWLRGERFSVYSHPTRVGGSPEMDGWRTTVDGK
jgi:FdhD protein